MQALQGPECADHSGTTIPIQTRTQYLRDQRAVMRKYLGRPLDKIKISGVVVRNVTSTSGEALVDYDLPAAKVGNYNWVTYTFTTAGGRSRTATLRSEAAGPSPPLRDNCIAWRARSGQSDADVKPGERWRRAERLNV